MIYNQTGSKTVHYRRGKSSLSKIRTWRPQTNSPKRKHAQEFDRHNVIVEEDNEKNINWVLSISILVQCWEAIPESEVTNSWAKRTDTIKAFNNAEAEADHEEY